MKKYDVTCVLTYTGHKTVEAETGSEAVRAAQYSLHEKYGNDFPESGKFGEVRFAFDGAGAVSADETDIGRRVYSAETKIETEDGIYSASDLFYSKEDAKAFVRDEIREYTEKYRNDGVEPEEPEKHDDTYILYAGDDRLVFDIVEKTVR